MRTVFTYGGPNPFTGATTPDLITMQQHGGRGALFSVTYGLQVSSRMTYIRAAAELGACIMHHLACEGAINNQGD